MGSLVRLPIVSMAAIVLAGCGTVETIRLGDGVNMEFVLIRHGSFMMGSDNGRPDEKPLHKVTFTKPFYLGRYEVTQEQWEAVMGINPSCFKGTKNPVESVSWDGCQTFLRKLAEKAPGREFRLPTEAEWEYACRAGTRKEYCYGDDADRLGQYAWFEGNSRETQPVGEKKPNAWGLYDMHGNVYEWCSDWYQNCYTPGDAVHPTGPARGSERVMRGSAWKGDSPGEYAAYDCRAATRYRGSPNTSYNVCGLRVVLEIP